MLSGESPARARAHSPKFAQGDRKVDNSTSVLASEQVAKEAMAILRSPLLRNCFDRAMHRYIAKEKRDNPQFASAARRVSISVTPDTLSLPADQEAGLSVTMNVETKTGLSIEERVVLDVARVGRALNTFSVEYGLDSTTPLPSSVFTQPLARLRTALQGAAPAA